MLFDVNYLGRLIRFDVASLPATATAQPFEYLVRLGPAVVAQQYAHDLYSAAPDFLSVQVNDRTPPPEVRTLNAVLVVRALALSTIAAAGALNTMLLNTREQVRDSAVLKALGMTPRQVVGAVAGLPAGVAIYHWLLGTIAARFVGDVLPADLFSDLGVPGLTLVGLTGVALALAGAAVPARWIAHLPAAETLRTE